MFIKNFQNDYQLQNDIFQLLNQFYFLLNIHQNEAFFRIMTPLLLSVKICFIKIFFKIILKGRFSLFLALSYNNLLMFVYVYL